MTKLKVKKRQLKPRTRNHGTMTEAQFFSMIRTTLRNSSMYWKPIHACRQKARRAYKGENKRQKWEYQCNNCKEFFDMKQIEVDHINPCGSLKTFADLPVFVESLFVEVDGYQVLCKKCHLSKSLNERKNDK